MIVLEMKAVLKPSHCSAIDEAIRTVQFIRNKALRLWMDAKREDKIDKYSLNKEIGLLLLVSMTIVRKRLKVKKVILSFRKIIVLWNIKTLEVNYRRIERK